MEIKRIFIFVTFIMMSVFAKAQCINTISPIQTNANAPQNSVNNVLFRIPIQVSAGCSQELEQIGFDFTGISIGDASKISIWYTGLNAVFKTSQAVLFGEVSPVTGTFTIVGDQNLADGMNNFWVTVDVSLVAVVGNNIDVRLNSYQLTDGTTVSTYTDGVDFNGEPPGNTVVTEFAFVKLNVGAAQTYINIQLAYQAIPPALTNNYIIEVWPDYNASSETFPLLFDQRITNGNKIFIWPHKDAEPIIEGDPGASRPLVDFNKGSNIVIDGRPGAQGTTRAMVFRNTRNTIDASSVLTFQNSSNSNTIRYCKIEGQANVTISGLINFLGSTSGVGNSSNEVCYNMFSDNNVSGNIRKPGVAIYSSGSANFPNEQNVIFNNEFNGIWDGDNVSSYVVKIFKASNAWNISSNHFYQRNSYVANKFESGNVFIGAGSDYTVSNNYMGGTGVEASESVFNINGGDAPFNNIYFGSSSSVGTNNISGNVISNFEYFTQASFAGYPALSFIYNEGQGNFNIIGNTFGSATDKDVVSLTNTNTLATEGFGFMGIVNDQAIDNQININKNTFGGIFIDGDSPFMESYLVYNKNEGTLIVDENDFGGSIANSIEMLANSQFIVVRNSSTIGVKARDNIFKHISNLGSSGAFNVIRNLFGNIEIVNNQFSEISIQSPASAGIVYHTGEAYIIDNNRFNDIFNTNSGTGDFDIIYVNSTFDGQVKGNTIGASGVANILSDKDGDLRGVHKYGLGGVFTCENNVIQGFEARNSTGSLSNMYLIDVDQGVGNVVNNQILNCFSNSQNTSANAIEGIRVSSSSVGQLIRGNVISGLNLTSLVVNGTKASGIEITEGAGKLESNYIHDILLGRASSPSSMLRGINYSGTGDWDMFNNVVWLKNNNGVGGFQYRAVSLNGTGNVRFYHNTLKLESSPNLYICQCLDINANGGFDVKNNVFQNLATGTSNPGYTKTISALSAYAIPKFDNNYHESPNTPTTLNNIIRWGTTYYDVASWSTFQSISGSFAGNEIVNNEGYASGLQFSGKGANLTIDVPVDKDGLTRAVTPWVGAYESAVAALNDTIVVDTFSADTVCTHSKNYEVVFSAYGTFNPGNLFVIQLSDELGSFSSPTNLDTLVTNTPSVPDTISVDMSNVNLSGSAFRLRVISTDNAFQSNDNGDDFVINPVETIQWTGLVDTNWFECGNWNKGRVPGSETTVIIPSTVNQPVIKNGIARCLSVSIDVDNGAQIILDSSNNGVLQIFKP